MLAGQTFKSPFGGPPVVYTGGSTLMNLAHYAGGVRRVPKTVHPQLETAWVTLSDLYLQGEWSVKWPGQETARLVRMEHLGEGSLRKLLEWVVTNRNVVLARARQGRLRWGGDTIEKLSEVPYVRGLVFTINTIVEVMLEDVRYQLKAMKENEKAGFPSDISYKRRMKEQRRELRARLVDLDALVPEPPPRPTHDPNRWPFIMSVDEIFNQREVWIDKDGRVMKTSELQLEYVANILRHVRSCNKGNSPIAQKMRDRLRGALDGTDGYRPFKRGAQTYSDMQDF